MNDSIAMLFIKYTNGTITPQELNELRSWISDSKANLELFNSLTSEKIIQEELADIKQAEQDVWGRILRIVPAIALQTPSPNIKTRGWYKWAMVAAIFLVIVSTVFILKLISTEKQSNVRLTVSDTTSKLFLKDGSSFNLDSLPTGQFIRQGNVLFTKRDAEHIVYSNASGGNGHHDEILYNAVHVAKGKRWNISLQDGTSFWLNAASQLSYPITFFQNERIVQLQGEAYFDVAKIKNGRTKIPFTVKAQGVDIIVTGTRFNVKGYASDSLVQTTLLEGRVSVTNNHQRAQLKPSQAGIFDKSSNNISIEKIDTSHIKDWINGTLFLDNEYFPSAMQAVGRKYNVEVIYDTSINPNGFSQKIYGFAFSGELSQLLKTFEIIFDNPKISITLIGSKVYVRPRA